MAVFWVVAPYTLVESYQRFGGACCRHHQGDELYFWPFSISIHFIEKDVLYKLQASEIRKTHRAFTLCLVQFLRTHQWFRESL
jgi:hypothetical protein